MPFDLSPSQVKALLPSPSGSKCEAFKRLVNYNTVLDALVSYLFDEAGLPSDALKTDYCALGCSGSSGSGGGGGGTPVPGMPAPSLTSASDGSLPTSVDLIWTTVVPSGGSTGLKYRIYRMATEDVNADPNLAAVIATVDAPTTTYNDSTVAVGTIYRYWVKAFNASLTSAFSNGDFGHASAPATTMDAISDLQATQGFFLSTSPAQINLVFTAPTGATKFTVWRNTTNDFSTATEIITDITPQDTATHYNSTQSPDQCWNNKNSQIVIYTFPPSQTIKYFFWIVAGKDSPPAISPESNAAQGWSTTNYVPYTGGQFIMTRATGVLTEGVDFTGTKLRVIMFGPGGGGAGGSQGYGGAGGGAGAVIVEEFVISAGQTIELISTPDTDDTGNAPALADGDEFTDCVFQINGVTKITAPSGHFGEFDPAGGGVGGLGETGTGTATPTIYNGADGTAAVGPAGGQSGYRFGNKRIPAAHYAGFSGGGFDGNGPYFGDPGSGTSASPGAEVLAIGGYGRTGFVLVAYGV